MIAHYAFAAFLIVSTVGIAVYIVIDEYNWGGWRK